jgi:glycosyltransferase involved in cell wall biosynthesis
VGRFFAGGHNKKQDVMINAFIEMQKKGWAKGWSLILVGRRHNDYASEKFVESLENLIDGYPIKLHYDLSYDELITYLNKAKIYWHATGFGENIFLNPEKFEHFGLSTIEAMQYGVVPVVYNAGGQPEIVRHGENGFLWNDTYELICYTKYLCQSESLWTQMSLKAKMKLHKHNSDEQYKWLREFLSVYIY